MDQVEYKEYRIRTSEGKEDILIPLSIFIDRSVSVLEVLVEYMKDVLRLSYHEIAFLTNRDDRTIWTCYYRAKKKREKTIIEPPKTLVSVPVWVFQDRSVSVLEVLVKYLKEKLGLTYHEIAVLMNRDDRTVWTCYSRAKKKEKEKNILET